MREIKFRAWMKPDKVMLSHEELMSIPVTYHDVFAGNSKYPCMQYTGLKDKNGKEIYEGDILSFENYEDETIIFNNGSFGYGNKDFISLSRTNISISEVIGNIYENKELLNA